MVDDVLSSVVDDVVRLPIVGSVDVEVVSEEVVLQGGRGAKFTDGEDVGFHVIHDGAYAFVLALGVVVGLIAVGKAAVVVAIIQQIVLHHSKGVL